MKRSLYWSVLAGCLIGGAGSCLYAQFRTATAAKPHEAPVAVLVNQVGYDVGASKALVVQVRDPLPDQPASFELVGDTGRVRYRGTLGFDRPAASFRVQSAAFRLPALPTVIDSKPYAGGRDHCPCSDPRVFPSR